MNVKFNVTRFNNEDVIATSFIPPELCDHFGTGHFLADGTADLAADGVLYFGGTQYSYSKKGGLEPYNGGDVKFPMPSPNEVPVAGAYYYFSDEGWKICEIQAH